MHNPVKKYLSEHIKSLSNSLYKIEIPSYCKTFIISHAIEVVKSYSYFCVTLFIPHIKYD